MLSLEANEMCNLKHFAHSPVDRLAIETTPYLHVNFGFIVIALKSVVVDLLRGMGTGRPKRSLHNNSPRSKDLLFGQFVRLSESPTTSIATAKLPVLGILGDLHLVLCCKANEMCNVEYVTRFFAD